VRIVFFNEQFCWTPDATYGIGGFNILSFYKLKELDSLLDISSHDPVIFANHPFNDVQSYFYWSSSSVNTN
jgi:hypothetical protein